MYIHKTPAFIKKWFPELTWSVTVQKDIIFLTFDDGPIPEVTEFVLATLDSFEAKATFFCIGDNIRKYPTIFMDIINKGHSVGNHTFHHLNGWGKEGEKYMDDIQQCEVLITQYYGKPSRLFRPPYGRLPRKHATKILSAYDIIMWDNLTGDFDPKLSPETCLNRAISNTEAGSVVTFHDSLKARNNLEFVLPQYLLHFSQKGFEFKAL
jgi:peptidoglycan/xylan/chitin deacetylase (PgdA/CDA1 family)